jgi:urease gamma subunit
MNLTPREKDKLLISLAAMVARGRLARGVRLNHPEAIALITDFVVEGARDGRSVADLMEAGAHVITAGQCKFLNTALLNIDNSNREPAQGTWSFGLLYNSS